VSDYDVIVVGGGGAGMAAAITVADAGGRVLLAESEGALGGSTALSGGVVYAAGTSVQAELGIEDSADALFDHCMTLNQWNVEPAVLRRLCDESTPTLEWLIDLGVKFLPEDLYPSGVEKCPRGHKASGKGAAIAEVLAAEVGRRRIDVALGNRVDALLGDGARVFGVSARGEHVEADAVILTTGGFGQNRELIERYYPDAAATGDWLLSMSAAGSRGDGLVLGLDAGAEVCGHNHGLLLATPGFTKHQEAVVPGWLVYVNRDGRRFVDERASYAVMDGVLAAQGGVCWALFDEQTRREAAPRPDQAEAFVSGMLPLSWVEPTLGRMAAEGRIRMSDTVAGLAHGLGLDAEALEVTVQRYNDDCALGEDREFFKEPTEMKPIAVPPFYAAEIRPAIVMLTSAGLRIDSDARVLDHAGRPIAGLWAAGETCGNALGPRYVAGGISLSNAIAYGRVAGRCAAVTSLTSSTASTSRDSRRDQ
jgi:fumarate reductase flavoprotein subunit